MKQINGKFELSKTEIKNAAAHARAMARNRNHNGTVEAYFDTEAGEVFYEEHLPNNWCEHGTEVVRICAYRCNENSSEIAKIKNEWKADLIDTIGAMSEEWKQFFADRKDYAEKYEEPKIKFTLVENDLEKLYTEWESCKDYKMYYSKKCVEMLNGAPEDERLADDRIDGCWDHDTDVYQGDDGKYYAVCMAYSDGKMEMEPFCWHEVQRKEGAAE